VQDLFPFLLALAEHGHGFLFAGIKAGPKFFFQRLVNAGPPRHAPEFPFLAQQPDLEVKKGLILAADFAEQVPILGTQRVAFVVAQGELLQIDAQKTSKAKTL
jgi:hypothetical protein